MRKIAIITGLLLAGVLAYGYARRPGSFGGAKPADLPTFQVRRETLTDSTVALGTIKPKVGAEVKVGSQLSGVVAKLRVNGGDRVAKGDLLASLQDAEWRARVDTLRAELAAAVAEMEYAESELARTERLADIVPRSTVDTNRKNLKVRQAAVQQLRQKLAESEIFLGYTVIRAPVAGTIASVSTYEGETVAASFAAPTFVTIVDLDRLEVQSYVDETDIGKVHAGQPVTFRVDSYPDKELAGVVRAIYPKAELVNNVVNYVVIIDITDKLGLLIRPEMTAHVSFILERRDGVVSVPRSALLREGGRTFVVVRAGEEWKKRPVKTGLQTPQRIEIVSGLQGGETIVADKQAWKDHVEESSS
jgi:macrolide-specific efflux system membrane fusion protein